MAYPLQLSINPGAWRIFITRKYDDAFRGFSQKIWKRDHYTCQFCGFQAQDYQEIVNLDQNYYNNKQNNLVTACCFCMQCSFLEMVGVGDFGGGNLIYMPELTQAQLNIFCHVLFSASTNDTAYKTTAQTIYRTLKTRTQLVEEKLGEGLSEPHALGQALIEMEASKEHIQTLLEPLRLLPSRGSFRVQIEHWAKTALASVQER